jgi:phenylpropionate dioxygenase-like ring-hydroxylating dioxygenase large terminal subunit
MAVDNSMNWLDFAALFKPTAEARGLLGRCYADPDYHRLEQRRLFAEGWPAVAVGAELPNPGDLLPVTVAGQPVLLVRDRGGQVRAFHNVCSHRGVMLVERAAHGQAVIRCPYHSWAYGLDGRLLKTPDIGGSGTHRVEGLDPAALGLQPVRAGLWGDVIFVNLSGAAPELADWLGPIARRWAPFDLGLLRYGGTAAFSVAANWKLAIENATEFYHLPWVHAGLNSYSGADVHYFCNAADRFAGTASSDYRPEKPAGETLPAFPGLSAALVARAEYPIIFPNLCFGLMADHAYIHIVHADGPERHRQDFHVYFVGDDAMAPRLAAARAATLERWRAVNAEDIGVVERLQRSRASDAYGGGRFSPAQDYVSHFFMRAVATHLGHGPPAGAPNFSGAEERTAPVRYSA